MTTTEEILGSPSHGEVHEEPARIEDTPAMDAAENRATATDVARGETVPPQ